MELTITWRQGPIDYDGSQLSSHWIYRTTGILGNALIAFPGACRVSLENMVDLADVRDQKPIEAHSMLHFLGEFFGIDLASTILLQRLLVSLAQQEIVYRAKFPAIVRSGNDLYDGDAKLSVSVATASPLSTLLHLGINISSQGTPVKTKGLDDYRIEPKEMALGLLETFRHELTTWRQAQAKVRPVP